ncbi:MAG: amidohydrolase [Marmoricola sp.]|nr:amidohydrolase [Marmoricola sp.]
MLVFGGQVFDPEAHSRSLADVEIADGKILRVAPALPRDGYDAYVDASGLIVSPGLVDFHSHVFAGQDLAVDPDVWGPPSGTTTFVDAGSAGAHLFGAFRRSVIDSADSRVVAFLNISTIGTTSILLSGELRTLAYSDEDACVACVEANRDRIVGIKVRASGDVAGANGMEALRRARRVADRVSLPLMVHVGPKLPEVDDILDLLRPGDIMTHCCTGLGDNGLALEGELRPSALAAQERGIRFDVGHGMGGFDVTVARSMFAAGIVPDTISTDIHAYSTHTVLSFPSVLSKFLALGLPLEDVLSRATLGPARIVGLDREGVGTLRPGAPADLALLRLVAEPSAFVDTREHDFTGSERLETAVTVRGGAVVFDGRPTTPATSTDRNSS